MMPPLMGLSLFIAPLLFEEAMDFQGDRGGGIDGGNDLDSFFPQVDQHASQWGQEVRYPSVYFSRYQ